MNMLNVEELVPTLKSGVEFNKLSTGNYILSNKDTQDYLKVNEKAYFVVSIIDGEKNLNELAKLFYLEYNECISVDSIFNLLYDRLKDYGILEGYGLSFNKEVVKPSYLKLSFQLISSDKLMYVVKLLSILFKKNVALLSLSVSLSVLVYAAINYVNFLQTIRLGEGLYLFVVLASFSLVFHELGHSAAARYFGASPGGIGFGFYLLTPVFYSDVTDIWRLSKWQRIIVNLAGVYFEMIFCVFITAIGIFFNNYAVIFTSLSVLILTLMNLIPFLRGDGYWILCDILDEPNLNSLSYMKLKEVVGLSSNDNRILFTKKDLLLAIYGLFNYSLVFLFLFYIIIYRPNVILEFPRIAFDSFVSFWGGNLEVSTSLYLDLIVPVIFFVLLFRQLKIIIKTRKSLGSYFQKKQHD